MEKDPQISFHNLPHSDSIETATMEKIEQLEKFFDGIIGCRVVIDSPHRSKSKGKLYGVKIDVTVPGDEIVVERTSDGEYAHKDIYIALRDAFNAMKRQLQDYVRRRQSRRHAG